MRRTREFKKIGSCGPSCTPNSLPQSISSSSSSAYFQSNCVCYPGIYGTCSQVEDLTAWHHIPVPPNTQPPNSVGNVGSSVSVLMRTHKICMFYRVYWGANNCKPTGRTLLGDGHEMQRYWKMNKYPAPITSLRIDLKLLTPIVFDTTTHGEHPFFIDNLHLDRYLLWVNLGVVSRGSRAQGWGGKVTYVLEILRYSHKLCRRLLSPICWWDHLVECIYQHSNVVGTGNSSV